MYYNKFKQKEFGFSFDITNLMNPQINQTRKLLVFILTKICEKFEEIS